MNEMKLLILVLILVICVVDCGRKFRCHSGFLINYSDLLQKPVKFDLPRGIKTKKYDQASSTSNFKVNY